MTTIQVNEHTKAGKVLIETARIMAEKFKGIEFVTENEADNRILLKKMIAARKSGVVERELVIETLDGIIEK